jgi:DnaJ-class molecular chaperone
MKMINLSATLLLWIAWPGVAAPCIDCHKTRTPNIVSDWQLSKHSKNGVECSTCHGEGHQSASDVAKALLPTPKTCQQCHPDRVAQFTKGKHAAAWAS